jgi:uncharacterized protein YqeY
MIELDALIKEAMKSGDKLRLETLRAIKTAEMEYRTAKNAKPLDETAEIGILRKMVSQREDAAGEYVRGGREDLAQKELLEAEIIKKFLPAEITREAIEDAAREIITDRDIKKMGLYIKALKEKFPTADGKKIAETVKWILNETA